MFNTRRVAVMMAAMAFIVIACSSEKPPYAGDGGTNTDDPADHDQHFIEGGGTTGGSVDGLLVMWFMDDPSGDPIVGTRVMVGNDPETSLTGETDSDGRVVFEDESLTGPVDVHFLAQDYPVGSIYGLNAAYITLERQKSDYDPQHSTITIAGSIDELENVPDPPGPGVFKMAAIWHGLPVEEVYTGEYDEIKQEEVSGMPVNMVAPAMGSNSWSLETYEVTGALFGYAGLFNPSTKEFTATHIALELGFDPTADLTDEPVLDFSIPLEDTVEITVENTPSMVEEMGASIVYDFGEGGAIGVPTFIPTTGNTISLAIPPVADEPFASADMELMIFGALADDEDGPSTVRIIADPTLTSGISTFTVDDMIGWPNDLSFDGVALQVTMPDGANQFSLSATDGDDMQIWGAAVWNPPSDTVAVPVFPEEWSWDGLPDSSLDFEASALVLNGDINEIFFDDFRDSLESFSESYLKVY
jgi:hypothetical protein